MNLIVHFLAINLNRHPYMTYSTRKSSTFSDFLTSKMKAVFWKLCNKMTMNSVYIWPKIISRWSQLLIFMFFCSEQVERIFGPLSNFFSPQRLQLAVIILKSYRFIIPHSVFDHNTKIGWFLNLLMIWVKCVGCKNNKKLT